jgi:hypothetical protein
MYACLVDKGTHGFDHDEELRVHLPLHEGLPRSSLHPSLDAGVWPVSIGILVE